MVKTSEGFESSDRSFLFGYEWSPFSLVKNDVPCIDGAFYGRGIHDFKDDLDQIGVVTNTGEGCDVIIDHHIQMHTDLKVITRLYKYPHSSEWEPHESKVLPIWIPNERKWMSSKSCVIHDIHEIFKLREKLLES